MTSVDERQPLLPPAALVSPPVQSSPPPYTAIGDEENQADTEDTAEQTVEAKQKRSWWSIGWYTLLIGLLIFFAVLFIKGFIDADDVEV
jgi:hypothetical protein